MDNPTIVFTRTSIGTVLMLVLVLIVDKNIIKIRIADVPVVIGISLSGSIILMIFYNIAVVELTLSLAAVLLSLSPVFVLIVSALVFKEKITAKKVICMAGAIIGCAMLTGVFEMSVSSMKLSSLGILAGIGSTVCNGLYIIFSRVATDRGCGTMTTCFYSFVFATIMLLPFVDWETFLIFIMDDPAGSAVFLIVQAICTSILPTITYMLALKYIETGRAAILEGGSEPAAAMVMGIILYSEVPTLIGAIGMIITIIALAVLSS